MKSLSDRQRAKRLANGETFLRSTIARPRTPEKQLFKKPVKSRSAPVKPRNPIKKKKRDADEYARIYGSKRRVEWVKRQRCIADRYPCMGAIQNHHIKTGGMGMKADARFIVPICASHHASLHRTGRQSFESFYNVHLETTAANCELAWQQHEAGE